MLVKAKDTSAGMEILKHTVQGCAEQNEIYDRSALTLVGRLGGCLLRFVGRIFAGAVVPNAHVDFNLHRRRRRIHRCGGHVGIVAAAAIVGGTFAMCFGTY